MATVKSDWEAGDEFAHTDENAHAAQTNANTAVLSELTSGGIALLLEENPDAIPSGSWNDLTDKPTVIGAGSTATAARTAIEAASLSELVEAVDSDELAAAVARTIIDPYGFENITNLVPRTAAAVSGVLHPDANVFTNVGGVAVPGWAL